MNKNKLKEKLRNNVPAVGIFTCMDSVSVEIAGCVGFDFVIIDAEHGTYTMENITNLLRAARSVGIAGIVRVPGTAAINIMRCLDAGADGIQVPQVSSIDEVREACSVARYYPGGMRGMNGLTLATRYGTIPFNEHMETSNEEVMVVIQVENVWAAEHIDEILSVKGIDTIFCGPWDLSQSLGIPGKVLDPKVTGLIEKVMISCAKKGVPTGMFVSSPEEIDFWLDRGVRYIAYGVDSGVMMAAMKDRIKTAQARIDSWEKTTDKDFRV